MRHINANRSIASGGLVDITFVCVVYYVSILPVEETAQTETDRPRASPPGTQLIPVRFKNLKGVLESAGKTSTAHVTALHTSINK